MNLPRWCLQCGYRKKPIQGYRKKTMEKTMQQVMLVKRFIVVNRLGDDIEIEIVTEPPHVMRLIISRKGEGGRKTLSLATGHSYET